MKRWARLTSAGRWGWDIEMLSHDESLPLALTMVEERVVHAWTERGARRKAERMVRRRAARDQRKQERIVIELPGYQKLNAAGVAAIPVVTSSTPPPPPGVRRGSA